MTNPMSSLWGSTFNGENQSENHHKNPSRANVWSIHGHLALPHNTQKSLYQNTSLWHIPCQVYEPVLSMGKIKGKTIIETHPEPKFRASMATWHCPATLISPHTKILPSDISLVKSVSWYFQWGKSNSKQTVEPIHRKSLDHPWPNNIPPQH